MGIADRQSDCHVADRSIRLSPALAIITIATIAVMLLAPGSWALGPHLPAQDDATLTQDLDALVTRAMSTGLSPGLAVAVVKDDAIVYAKGFGYADREHGRPVAADTQFYIASTSKSFTALTAEILADRKQIDLDLPLDRALPDAHFHPDLRPHEITVRDLLTHTHGIDPEGPVSFRTSFSGDFTDAVLLDVLRFHGPASTGRAFAYSNLGYNLFGIFLDERLKEGWQEAIRREVLDPLGMNDTTIRMSEADPDRLALPYELDATARPARVDYLKEDANMHAAGGHLSTARDLARYLVAELNEGRIDGRQALPSSSIEATHRALVAQNRDYGSFHRSAWALGWDVATYDGDLVLQRLGAFTGFFSHLSFMPERHVGVVVLSNGGFAGGPISDFLATGIYDLVLRKPELASREETKWAAFSTTVARARLAVEHEFATRRARPQTTALPLEAYVGTFVDPGYGTMVWSLEHGRLEARMGLAHCVVEVFDGPQNRFRVQLTTSGDVVTFRLTPGATRPDSLRFLGATFIRVK